VRRDLLDHVIVFDERHLRRLLREYVAFYNAERVHTVLRDAPNGQPIERPPFSSSRLVSHSRLGGLHHHYGWQNAA
jgi:putative transposase